MKTGILLINLGTPDSPSVPDVRRYLRQFLMDPRVIDINPVGRFFLVNFIITPFRSPKSAKLYKEIWTENGSPLLYYTRRQAELLQKKLDFTIHNSQFTMHNESPESQTPNPKLQTPNLKLQTSNPKPQTSTFVVDFAMRYQNPSIASVLQRFNQPSFNKIKIIPLFPQYASASTGSVQEEVMRVVSKWQAIPDIEFVSSFFDDEDMIRAFADNAIKYEPQSYDHVLMSFHGLPERQIHKADVVSHCNPTTHDAGCCSIINEKNNWCYRAQCYGTARLLASKLNIPAEKYTVCFQSRLGKAEWIKPYTTTILQERAAKGDKRLLVFAPAFTVDCLETIYEIGVEYDELFKSLGGEKVQMVESLNEHPAFIETLVRLSR